MRKRKGRSKCVPASATEKTSWRAAKVSPIAAASATEKTFVIRWVDNVTLHCHLPTNTSEFATILLHVPAKITGVCILRDGNLTATIRNFSLEKKKQLGLN
jgi:hypothetical protein